MIQASAPFSANFETEPTQKATPTNPVYQPAQASYFSPPPPPYFEDPLKIQTNSYTPARINPNFVVVDATSLDAVQYSTVPDANGSEYVGGFCLFKLVIMVGVVEFLFFRFFSSGF